MRGGSGWGLVADAAVRLDGEDDLAADAAAEVDGQDGAGVGGRREGEDDEEDQRERRCDSGEAPVKDCESLHVGFGFLVA